MTLAEYSQALQRPPHCCPVCRALANHHDGREWLATCMCEHVLIDFQPGYRVRIRQNGPNLTSIADLRGEYGEITAVDVAAGKIWVCVRPDCFDSDASPIGFQAARLEPAYCHWSPPPAVLEIIPRPSANHLHGVLTMKQATNWE